MSRLFSCLGVSGFVTLSLAFSGIAVHSMDKAEIEVPEASVEQLQTQDADREQIMRLTQGWFEAWSPGAGTIDWDTMKQFFIQTPEQLLVFDDAGDSVVVLKSWDEYRSTWEPFMQSFTRWQIAPEGDIQVLVDGNLATTAFTLAGGGTDRDGQPVEFRQRGTHVWQRINGQWVIVHEHLTTDG